MSVGWRCRCWARAVALGWMRGWRGRDELGFCECGSVGVSARC